jgi:hypothetical protein
LRLRPHHIFCDRFLPLELVVRGEEFARAVDELKELARPDSDAAIVVVEGPDQLCVHCPDYGDGRCESRLGDEEKVRKWDEKIREGLGIAYGQRLTVRALLALIEEKAPLAFCATRCPWKAVCRVFDA